MVSFIYYEFLSVIDEFVFCYQWTDVLDLIGKALTENSITYTALHTAGKFQVIIIIAIFDEWVLDDK